MSVSMHVHGGGMWNEMKFIGGMGDRNTLVGVRFAHSCRLDKG